MSTEAISISVKAVPPVGDGLFAFQAPRAVSVQDAARRFDLAEALEEIGARAAAAGTALDFRVDEESGRMIVSVMDKRDGSVLRQMPSEEALRIARNLARYESQLIEAHA